MNRDSFATCVMREPAPALRPGQIVVADTLSSHKSTKVIDLLRSQGNDLVFLPPCPPDPCGAENRPPDCFPDAPHPSKWHSQNSKPKTQNSKLKTLIRKAAATTSYALWKQVGAVCDLFQPAECRNHFIAARYGVN